MNREWLRKACEAEEATGCNFSVGGLASDLGMLGDDLVFADPDAVIPGVVWWEGPTACSICGWQGRSVIPIDEGHVAPVVAMECPECRNRTLRPAEEDGR